MKQLQTQRDRHRQQQPVERLPGGSSQGIADICR
jgi:hypothetical protein